MNLDRSTTRSRAIVAVAVLVVIGAVAARYGLPELVRRVAVTRLQALTHRPVRIEGVTMNPWTGRVQVRALRIGGGAVGEEIAGVERLDARVSVLALLRGTVSIREAVVERPVVRVVRSANGFNISDLFDTSGPTRAPLHITVERFAIHDGLVTFEDRALREPHTWRSENIEIRANNVSTGSDGGEVEASAVTAGAPSSVKLDRVRLSPLHFRARAIATGVDLSMVRMYFPPDARVVVAQGHASSVVTLEFDARTGIRAEATGTVENLVLVDARSGARVLGVPRMTTRVGDLSFRDDQLEVRRLELIGTASVLDPRAHGGPRFEPSTMSARLSDLTWPVRTPGRVDVRASVPGGGTISLDGALRAPPASSQLRLRMAHVNLAPWARFLPTSAQVVGTAESSLDIDEPLAAAIPARVRGSIVLGDLAVRDGGREVAAARRIVASGLVVHWPAGVVVDRVQLDGPRAVLERDGAGGLTLQRLVPSPSGAAANAGARASAPSTPVAPSVAIGELVVRGGAVRWRDATISPAVSLQLSRIEASVKGAGWPLAGSIDLRVGLQPPGGGHLGVVGRVDARSLAGDVRVDARAVEISPYLGYARTPARVTGRADVDLAVHVPGDREQAPTARGTVSLTQLDVRDEQRTLLRLERGTASGIQLVWSRRLAVEKVDLDRPWVLIERDEKARLTLGAVLRARPAQSPAPNSGKEGRQPAMAVEIARLAIEGGGARLVDRSLAPPFAVDLSQLAVTADGLRTAPGGSARVSLSGQLGSDAVLALTGTVGPLPGPIHAEMSGTLDRFWVPRTDSYLQRYVGWQARQGWLTSAVTLRLDRDALEARTDVRLSQLDLVRGGHDEAQSRIGLPLGLIVSLMKDSRGDINVSVPVGGRLSDPRFDFREAIWRAVRNVAIKTISLPVSWIGRVRLTSDSRIDRIEIDPIPFEPGTARLLPAGQAQLARLVRFLGEVPAARVRLTPVMSARDLEALRRRALDEEIQQLSRGAGVPIETAVMRLFAQRFPAGATPETPDAAREALVNGEPVATAAADELAKTRIQAVKDGVRKAGIDRARLPDATPVEGTATTGGLVALDVTTSEPPARPPRSMPGVLRPTPGSAPTRTGVDRRASEPAG